MLLNEIKKENPLHLIPKVGNKTTKFDSEFQFKGSLQGIHGRPKSKAGDDGKTYFLKNEKVVAIWDKIQKNGIIFEVS